MTAATNTAATNTDVRLTDSTLRDGSHAMAHQFTEGQVRAVVHALDGAGVQVIEVTHGDGLGGCPFTYGFSLTDEIKLIKAAVGGQAGQDRGPDPAGRRHGRGTWQAYDAGASVARVATHCIEADVSLQRRRRA